jgi:hypothetical protein
LKLACVVRYKTVQALKYTEFKLKFVKFYCREEYLEDHAAAIVMDPDETAVGGGGGDGVVVQGGYDAENPQARQRRDKIKGVRNYFELIVRSTCCVHMWRTKVLHAPPCSSQDVHLQWLSLSYMFILLRTIHKNVYRRSRVRGILPIPFTVVVRRTFFGNVL